jgi:hypothetical protein
MPLAVKHLSDDPAKLKALLIKERSASEKREDELKQQIHSLLEACVLRNIVSMARAARRHPTSQNSLMKRMRVSMRSMLSMTKSLL